MFVGLFWSVLGCGPDGYTQGNGISEDAPMVVSYSAMGYECCGDDPHPVHGVESSDNGFILVGKSIDSEGGLDGFVVKIGSELPAGTSYLNDTGANQFEWGTRIGMPGTFEVVNSVVSIDDVVLIAGAKESNDGNIHRFIAKLDLVTGTEIWSKNFPVGQDSESAIESIFMTSDGGLVVAGFVDGEKGMIEGFKSYGNPVSGKANVMIFSAEQLSEEDAPDAPIWETVYDSYGSIRSIKTTMDGYVFVAPTSEELYASVLIDHVGSVVWTQNLNDHGEATDIAVMTKEGIEVGIAITGHHKVNGGIDGSVTVIDLDGERRWTNYYGNPSGGIYEYEGLDDGDPKLIFDECWGIQNTDHGSVVLACGTGIERCGILDFSCQNDPRVKWRGLLMEVDSEGRQLWFRTDSYYFEEEETANASASEHVIRTNNGRIASVVDQDFGVGLLILEPPQN